MSSSPNTVLSVRHVTLRYESGAQALEDLSLDVRRGERLCVLGANGSGKSTLASVLCGLLAPDEGTVTLVGKKVFDASREAPIDFDAYRLARRSLGLVFQNPDDQIVTTVVEEDVAFGPENLMLPPEEIGLRVERELRRVALTDYAKADPTRLSGGQKQRVAIAGALAMEPEVLVFDEPGSLLDVRGRTSIMRVMARLASEGTTVVHITHFMEEALEADRVIVLDAGRIVLEGTPQDVFAHADLISSLGLEEPFIAQLSRRLGLGWTCDENKLVRDLLLAAGLGSKRLDVGEPDTSAEAGSPGTSPVSVGATKKPEEKSPLGTASLTKRDTPLGPSVIQASHVSFAYRNDRKALDDVSFGISAGTSVSIIGQTGSGKSTLLRLLCALDPPDAGSIIVNGIDTKKKRDRRRLHGTIGYVMQHPERQLFAETVLEDVAFGPTNMGLSPSEINRRCQHALKLVGLVGLDDASPFELSGGQRRLCAIAGVIAMEPNVLVLDEPMAGLDPRGRRELHALLNDLHAHGITTVQVTHSMDDAAQAEHVIALDQARIMLEGAPEQVFCASNATRLAQAGLGLPQSLALAIRLEQEGLPSLDAPLNMEALVCALREVA